MTRYRFHPQAKYWLLSLLIWAAIIAIGIHSVFAAEIPLPRLRPYQPCLAASVNPVQWQVLRIDPTCKSGLRWVNPERK